MLKICVFTGTRAEYGLLRPLLFKFKEDREIDLTIVVSGSHLSEKYGYTYKEILKDEFPSLEIIDIHLKHNHDLGICKSMGIAFEEYSNGMKRVNPDMMVILGDRYEAFAMASVCHVMKIPIAHIHGGEVTEGAYDDAFRHSISKMSYLHFVSCDEYRRRVIQLGESPERVFTVGALGVENIINMDKMSKQELGNELGFNLDGDYCVITCHPETLKKGDISYIEEMLSAIDEWKELKCIFTGSNSDGGGEKINKRLIEYAFKNRERCIFVKSLGIRRYLSAVESCEFVMGNSSSGVIEVPAFKKPVINIGDRQKGRIRSKCVIDIPWDKKQIMESMKYVQTEKMREVCMASDNIFGDGNTSKRILSIMKDFLENDKITLEKKFYDVR
ncbi:UDP-N-acetylglucosamine 2-epimerase [Oceanirhabdus seepicola]|uniref:UDP-N-acetylglucosamine 2-epimerase (Hydrolyzing) n=1 Tax=Oceanirhabdus seepicola TaxID=2828781 RepID=A0A9J6P778_9CLOT|nr:UDP-N-acetylglucosamine 2-epimerase [Oceanirhabdus seepicola]MCM1992639.1 UDP-N-acetylglucosamine 2-epimerase (hydrolyzing) [Oceanirhabdus seepicola]